MKIKGSELVGAHLAVLAILYWSLLGVTLPLMCLLVSRHSARRSLSLSFDASHIFLGFHSEGYGRSGRILYTCWPTSFSQGGAPLVPALETLAGSSRCDVSDIVKTPIGPRHPSHPLGCINFPLGAETNFATNLVG